MRNYATTILIWLSFIVGEFHTLFEREKYYSNWIIADYVPMPIQWNVKYAMMEVWNILIFGALILWRENRTNKAAAKAMLTVAVFDALLYFYNFKREGYVFVYLIFILSFIIFYRHGSRTANRQGNISIFK